jgi:hypothetical protein
MAASAMIANVPDYREGPTVILSRSSVEQIRNTDGVLGMYAVSSSSWKVQAPQRSANVTVYGVTPDFLYAYHLMEQNNQKISTGTNLFYIGPTLADQLLVTSKQPAELLLRDDTVGRMPPQVLEKADWAAMKQPILLEPTSLVLPQGMPAFENALFTTGPISKVTVGSMHILPYVRLFVLTESDKAVERILSLSPALTTMHSGYTVKISRFSDSFAPDMTLESLDGWEKFYLGASITLLAATIFILTISRLKQTRDEVALRFIFGANQHQAMWYATRGLHLAILSGAVPGLLLGSFLNVANYPALELRSFLIFAAVFFSCIVFNVILFRRMDTQRIYRCEELG